MTPERLRLLADLLREYAGYSATHGNTIQALRAVIVRGLIDDDIAALAPEDEE